MSSKASEKAATMKSKLGDEEYQNNLKKNAAETWTKTTSTLSSWWSTAATSVSNVLNEDGAQNVTLYNREAVTSNGAHSAASRPKKKMAALSSDQYFGENTESKRSEVDILGMNGNETKKKSIDQIEAPFKWKQKKKAIDDDFDDEWGFGDDGDGEEEEEREKEIESKSKQGMDSLLDFEPNQGPRAKVEKDANSSDDLADFMNELDFDENKNGHSKSGGTHSLSKKGGDDEEEEEDDWGWD